MSVLFSVHGSQCVKEWFHLSFITYAFIFYTTTERNKVNIVIGYDFIHDSVHYLFLVVLILIS